MSVTGAIIALELLFGAAIMIVTAAHAVMMKKSLSKDIAGKWNLIVALIFFFIGGYVIFISLLLLEIDFPVELITGSIFFAGACFVYIVVRLIKKSVSLIYQKSNEQMLAEEHLKDYTTKLEFYAAELDQNIEELKTMEKNLRKSEERYRSLVESTEDSIYVVDREYRYAFMNRKHALRMHLLPEQILGRRYGEFHSPDETEEFMALVDRVVVEGQSIQHEHRSARDERYFLRTLSPIMDAEGKLSGVTVISKDMTKQKHLEEKLRSLSLVDELTGLYNRRGLFALADQHLKVANRKGEGIFVLYADLDNLKRINDSFGHLEGDRALVETANLLKDTFRESDTIARIGGDEFVVMPAGSTSSGSGSLTRRLQENLDRYNGLNKVPFRLSLSTGIAYYDPENPCSLDELISRADSLMYRQKKEKQSTQ